jgi:predicted nuclease of predicted toxin-antitoxin system
LADLFPGSDQVGRLGLAEADDRQLWDYAGANGFVLVSLDSDFAEFAALKGPPPKVI